MEIPSLLWQSATIMRIEMKTNQSPTGIVELTEFETDNVAGGAPTGDPGNAYGRGTGAPGNDKGQGPQHNNYHGRFQLA